MRFTVKTIGEVLTLAEYLDKQFIIKPYGTTVCTVKKVIQLESGSILLQTEHGSQLRLEDCDFIKLEVTK